MTKREVRELRRIRDIFLNSSEAFDKIIADGTTNQADIASHYPLNPQRRRLYDNGNRVNFQYGEGADSYTDELDVHVLTPGGGDTLKLQTTERFRYVVQYVGEWSQALSINQELQGDDELRVLFEGDPVPENAGAIEDGHGYIFRADESLVATWRDGNIIASEEVELDRPLTDFTILSCRYNWYNVGNNVYRQTYTDDGDQINSEVARTSIDGGRGERIGNGRITVEVKTDSTTENLEVDVGSCGYVILGDVDSITRTKTTGHFGLNHSGSGEWEALLAIRIQDGKEQVNTNITNMQILDVDGDSELIAVSVDPDLTDASGFDPSPEFDDDSTSTENTTNVNEFPDGDGVVQEGTPASTTNPGGYQIGYAAAADVGGPGAGVEITSETPTETIHDTDVVLLLGKTNSDTTFDVVYTTRQEW